MMFGGIIWNGSGNLANEKEVIVMSWYNPSQDEAAEEYYASKSRYANAANQRASAAKAAENCSYEKSQALSAIESCKNDKLISRRELRIFKRLSEQWKEAVGEVP